MTWDDNGVYLASGDLESQLSDVCLLIQQTDLAARKPSKLLVKMYSKLTGLVGTGIRWKFGPPVCSHFLVSPGAKKKDPTWRKSIASSQLNVGTLGDSSQDPVAASRKRKGDEKQGVAEVLPQNVVELIRYILDYISNII